MFCSAVGERVQRPTGRDDRNGGMRLQTCASTVKLACIRLWEHHSFGDGGGNRK